MAANLPDSNSPTLALLQPTEEEKIAQLKKNGTSWRGALSLGAYLKREQHLASQRHTRDGGITYWVLVDTAEQTNGGKRTVLCGCETYRKKAIVAKNGEVKDVLCHGIGSVFCPNEHRGRGYAQRMMRDLGKLLRTWQTEEDGEKVLFSILFSDIGKSFYAAHGWSPFSSSHISLHTTHSNLSPSPSLPQTSPLSASSFSPLCTADTSLLRAHLSKRPATAPVAIAQIPSEETVEWHHAREEFVAAELHCKFPNVKGAIAYPDDVGRRVWCYWTRMWYNSNPDEAKDNTLHILRLVVEDAETPLEEFRTTSSASSSLSNGSEEGSTAGGSEGSITPPRQPSERHVLAIEALLREAMKEAERWKMADVEIWNPTAATVLAVRRIQKDAQVVDRDRESIASLMWYGDEKESREEAAAAAAAAAAAEMGSSEKLQDWGKVIDWVGNEKYGWC